MTTAADPATLRRLDRTLIRGLVWTGGVRWSVQLFTWLTTILVARLLTPDDYGVFGMAAVYLSFVMLISEFGLGSTVVTLRDLTEDHLAQLNTFAIGLGLAAFGVSCLAALPLGAFYRAPQLPPVIIAMSLTFVSAGVRAIPNALLQRDLRFGRLAVFDAIQSLVQSAVTLAFAARGARYWSLVAGGLAAAVVSTTLTLAARRTRLAWPKRIELRDALAFTRHTLLARVAWYAYHDADFIIAGRVLGRAALGAYSFGWTLANAPVEKITALVMGVTPAVLAEVQADRVALRRYFIAITRALALVACPLTIGLALTARDVVTLGLGAKWAATIVPLQLLAAYATVRATTPLVAQVLTAIRDARFIMYVNIIGAVGLPLAFYIGSFWGTGGIGLAWIIAHPILIVIPLLHRLFRALSMTLVEYLRAIRPAIVGCATMTLAVVLLNVALADMRPVWRLVVDVLAGGAAYFGALSLWHRADLLLLRDAVRSLRSGSTPPTSA